MARAGITTPSHRTSSTAGVTDSTHYRIRLHNTHNFHILYSPLPHVEAFLRAPPRPQHARGVSHRGCLWLQSCSARSHSCSTTWRATSSRIRPSGLCCCGGMSSLIPATAQRSSTRLSYRSLTANHCKSICDIYTHTTGGLCTTYNLDLILI